MRYPKFWTYRLNKAGDVAARSLRPSEDGFMVKTTCKFFMTYWLKYFFSFGIQLNLKKKWISNYLLGKPLVQFVT